jgi:hypothetical protein
MIAAGVRIAVVALTLGASVSITAQDRAEVRFGSEQFDVTGAGELELAPLDPVLLPFSQTFGLSVGLAVVLTLDKAGNVTACAPEKAEEYASATAALCAHALESGRFRLHPAIALDYDTATYRLFVYRREGRRNESGAEFYESDVYPLERTRVRFGDDEIPPEDQRLTLADLEYEPMEYPRSALRSEIMARVVVALRFDADGNVSSCSPIESSNTARIAYETCKVAAGSFRLKNAPDARPFVLSIGWNIPR